MSILTGETMGITRVDDRHTMTILKLNGQQFGSGRRVGKTTETWVRK